MFSAWVCALSVDSLWAGHPLYRNFWIIIFSLHAVLNMHSSLCAPQYAHLDMHSSICAFQYEFLHMRSSICCPQYALLNLLLNLHSPICAPQYALLNLHAFLYCPILNISSMISTLRVHLSVCMCLNFWLPLLAIRLPLSAPSPVPCSSPSSFRPPPLPPPFPRPIRRSLVRTKGHLRTDVSSDHPTESVDARCRPLRLKIPKRLTIRIQTIFTTS